MTDVILPIIGACGGLVGLAGFLHFWNTRKGTRKKTDSEAYGVYSQWVAGAMGQAAAENVRINEVLVAERSIATRRTGLLVALVLDLLDLLRGRGATYEETEPYAQRLDDARRL